MHLGGEPKYIGKANNLSNRLGQHYRKLMGRRNIRPEEIGYKCLILDRSMSTAANERLLIDRYEQGHPGMWNGCGFGINDPGRRRDTSRPNAFDREYPIRLNVTVPDLECEISAGELAMRMKASLPYLFRYNLLDCEDEIVDPRGVENTPDSLLQVIVNRLGKGWRGAILSYGLVLYRDRASYPYGRVIDPEA